MAGAQVLAPFFIDVIRGRLLEAIIWFLAGFTIFLIASAAENVKGTESD